MATLTYAAFAKLWKRLISRRRARELNVDLDDVWQQLVTHGRFSRRCIFAARDGSHASALDVREPERGVEARPIGSRRTAKPTAKPGVAR
jgi:hypothetical protein